MTRPRHLLAVILGGLHLVFCILFFAAYFTSKDPNRGLLFLLFVPIDPWIIPLSIWLEGCDAVFAGILTVVGTAQWWVIGRLTETVFRQIRQVFIK